MATVVGANQVQLGNGQKVTAQQGGWYDGQQFWGGTLSNPGQINSQSNQPGAGTAVSQQVIAQTNPNNVAYVNQQREQLGLPDSPDATNATPVPQEAVVAPGSAAGGGTVGTGGTGGTGSPLDLSGFGGTAQPALNLPDLYNGLNEKAGISKMEQDLTDKQNAFNQASSKINDNPWLSEADRVGRIQKLTTDYNNNIKNTQDAMAMKRQDVQTQLDLATKQFDINSQTATQALNEFNTLLQSGALAGASGSDIAAITRATGISSGEIQAAINSQQQKDTPTSVQTVDDGTNVYSVVLNTKTGAVISKQVLSQSKPSASSSSSGGKPGSPEYLSSAIATISPQIVGKLNSYGNISPADWNKALSAWLGAGLTQKDFVANFGQYADQNRGDFAQSYGFTNPKPAATVKANQAVNTKPL